MKGWPAAGRAACRALPALDNDGSPEEWPAAPASHIVTPSRRHLAEGAASFGPGRWSGRGLPPRGGATLEARDAAPPAAKAPTLPRGRPSRPSRQQSALIRCAVIAVMRRRLCPRPAARHTYSVSFRCFHFVSFISSGGGVRGALPRGREGGPRCCCRWKALCWKAPKAPCEAAAAAALRCFYAGVR